MSITATIQHGSAATTTRSTTQTPATSRGMLLTGRIITGFVALFLLMDGVLRIARFAPYVDGLVQFGYPAHLAVPIGLSLVVGTVLYLVPRTAVLGAIVLTGYLGGAVASHVRMEDRFFVTGIIFGVLVWAGLYLREPRLRALLSLRS
jgi:hypothetical protein